MDQVGYLKGRFISENVRTSQDIIDFTEFFNISGLIALIDFQKAFDTVRWSFLIKSLGAFNFGEKGPFKTLGVWFAQDEEVTKLSLMEKMNNQIINIWAGQCLSLKGKITIIKSLVVSKIINICSMVYVPSYFIDDVDRLLFDFLWGESKRPKVKKDVVTNDISLGGLKMVNFRNTIKSLKAIWVRRLFTGISTKYKNKWVHITEEMIDIKMKTYYSVSQALKT